MVRKGGVLIGVVIHKETDKALRKILPNKKGALSEFVEKAILEKLEKDYGIILCFRNR